MFVCQGLIYRKPIQTPPAHTSNRATQSPPNTPSQSFLAPPRLRSVITGAHVVVYSEDAEADRNFLSDVFGFDSVDAVTAG